MKIVIQLTFLSATVVLSPGALAQDASTPTGQSNELEKPYEIVITGQPTRANLRALITEVEEDFFARFNELNIDDAYDMYCYEYIPTMSHIRKRACEPMFLLRERAANSSELALALGGDPVSGRALGSVYLESPNEMRKNLQSHYEILIEKMEELRRTDQELGEIAKVMEQLKYRLETYGR